LVPWHSYDRFSCAPRQARDGAAKGGGELFEAFRTEVERRGLPASVVLRNVCSRRHHEGPVVFVYPDDVWYTRVGPEDVPEIVERHLADERLQTTGLRQQHNAHKPCT